jgi:hypothetical protein
MANLLVWLGSKLPQTYEDACEEAKRLGDNIAKLIDELDQAEAKNARYDAALKEISTLPTLSHAKRYAKEALNDHQQEKS